MAVGCIEPQFFAEMLSKLEINPAEFGPQNKPEHHAQQHATLEAIFASKTRDEWAEVFDVSDACVSPVLTYEEAANHPQNMARGGLKKQGAFVHPRSAPVFISDQEDKPFTIPGGATDTEKILSEIGYSAGDITRLSDKNITG